MYLILMMVMKKQWIELQNATVGGVTGASNSGSSSTSAASSISTSGAHSAYMVAVSDAAMIAKRRMLVG
jgi:hypothetical protein